MFENSQEKFDIGECEAGKLTLYIPHQTIRSYNQINMVWLLWLHEKNRESGKTVLYIKISYMIALLYLLIKKGMTYLLVKPDKLEIDLEKNKHVLPSLHLFCSKVWPLSRSVI